LLNNLRAAGYEPPVISRAAEHAGVSLQARAEALPLEAAAKLYRALHGN
jgi:16S rRNA (adenine1518-N6/adenine1519-N6)-dimethyltransferase